MSLNDVELIYSDINENIAIDTLPVVRSRSNSQVMRQSIDENNNKYNCKFHQRIILSINLFINIIIFLLVLSLIIYISITLNRYYDIITRVIDDINIFKNIDWISFNIHFNMIIDKFNQLNITELNNGIKTLNSINITELNKGIIALNSINITELNNIIRLFSH